MTEFIPKPNFEDRFTGSMAALLVGGTGLAFVFQNAVQTMVSLGDAITQHSSVPAEPARILAAGIVLGGAALLNGMLTGKTYELITYGSAIKHDRVEVKEEASPQPPMVS